MNTSTPIETTAETMAQPEIKKTGTEFQGESKIYYGPTLKGGQLLQFATFRNGIPPNVQELIDKTPMIASAIVDISDFPRIMQALNDKNSPESALVGTLKGVV